MLHAGTASRMQSLMSDSASTTATTQLGGPDPGDANPGYTERMTDAGHTRLVHTVKRRSNVPPSAVQLTENDKINLVDAGHRLILMMCKTDCWPHHGKRPRTSRDGTVLIGVVQMTVEVILATNALALREQRDRSPSPLITEVYFRHQVRFVISQLHLLIIYSRFVMPVHSGEVNSNLQPLTLSLAMKYFPQRNKRKT